MGLFILVVLLFLFCTIPVAFAEASESEGWPAGLLDFISFGNIFWTIVLLGGGYGLIRFIVRILELIAERTARFRITIKSLIPIVRIVIWAVIILIVVKGIYDPPIEMLLAGVASVAIAVGLASQDLLKNVFGGLVLLFERPFQVGDKIEVAGHYGEVAAIGLLTTRIVTPDDSMISIPNMEVMNSPVSNANSGELDCQVVAEIYLPIDVDTQRVRKLAIETAQVSKYIYLKKPIVVLFFNEMYQRKSYLKIRLKAYVMDIRYEFQFKSDMTEILIRALINNGIVSAMDLE